MYLLFINLYPINSFQDHMTWFLHCVLKWLLSRPFDLILLKCSQCVTNWLLSRPYDPILSLCILFTVLKTIWPHFMTVYSIHLFQDQLYLILSLGTQLTPFRTIWPIFCTMYPIDSFQDHMTWFLHCVPNWFLSKPFDLIVSLYTHLTPFKTIGPNFIAVYPIDSFQDHLT